MLTTKMCERCLTAPAVIVFFMFDDLAKITMSTSLCNECYLESGLDSANPDFVETFPANRHLATA